MDDRRIETHSESMDPDWRQEAELEARTAAKRSKRRAKSSRAKRLAPWVSLGLVVLVAAGVTVSRLPDSGANEDVLPALGSTPSVPARSAAVDLAQPYANTPAAQWKDGSAGFTTPAPVATGEFSAAEVSRAYEQAIRAVTLGRLDPKMVTGHDPSDYLALFAPNEAKRLKGIFDEADKFDGASYVTQIADGYRLLPTGPRLNGRLSASPGQKGELLVRAEYVIGYAFDTPKPETLTSPLENVAFIREDETYSVFSGSQYSKADRGLGIGSGVGGEVYAIGCTAFKAGFLAPAYSDPMTAGHGDSGPLEQIPVFDLDKPLYRGPDC